MIVGALLGFIVRYLLFAVPLCIILGLVVSALT